MGLLSEIDETIFADVGALAAWSVSSAKPGFGVEHLRDPNINTLWQSEGPQPHLITIKFAKKQPLGVLCIYADVASDDSYTPQKLSIRAGGSINDLHEIDTIELERPNGWMYYTLSPKTLVDPVRVNVVQIAIISNHLNGKDTHVRGIRVLAPKRFVAADGLLPFGTVDFLAHDTIR